jgi:hypothetical protein
MNALVFKTESSYIEVFCCMQSFPQQWLLCFGLIPVVWLLKSCMLQKVFYLIFAFLFSQRLYFFWSIIWYYLETKPNISKTLQQDWKWISSSSHLVCVTTKNSLGGQTVQLKISILLYALVLGSMNNSVKV